MSKRCPVLSRTAALIEEKTTVRETQCPAEFDAVLDTLAAVILDITKKKNPASPKSARGTMAEES